MRLIDQIRAKFAKGERLGLAEGVALYKEGDLLELGKLAEEITDRKVGRQVYYSINRHINYTNVCRFRCGFCGFSRGAEEEGAYTMSAYEVAEQAEEAWREGATEVHIVGGVSGELEFEYYLEMLSRIRDVCPELHVKAFTAVEIVDLAAKANASIEQTLETLMDFGLASLPGGGAEILSDAYFAQACPQKPKPAEWLEVHRTAHQLGLMTNATMLFGYVESIEDRVRHLLRLRELQDKSLAAGGGGKFQCFVPLPYVNPKSEILNSKQIPRTEIQMKETEELQSRATVLQESEILRSAQNDIAQPGAGVPQGETERMDVVDELKTVAISRLLLDNFDHIKSFWPMLGEQTAQMALCFGADDLDGTVREYRIVEQQSHTHAGNARDSHCVGMTPDKGGDDTEHAHDKRGHGTGLRTHPTELSVEQIRRMIEETGRDAVQRDGYYKILNPNI